jgi:hypothetical protein
MIFRNREWKKVMLLVKWCDFRHFFSDTLPRIMFVEKVLLGQGEGGNKGVDLASISGAGTECQSVYKKVTLF